MKVNFTKDELQLISDAMIPFLHQVIGTKDNDTMKLYTKLCDKLERLLP